MKTSTLIEKRFLDLADEQQAAHLARFFKTGPGEYGFGDKFLGIRVPVTRSIVKEYRDSVQLDDCNDLVKSEWHEIRLAGFLLYIELYLKAKKERNEEQQMKILCSYMLHITYGNNWDLVDLVAPKLLGDYLLHHPDEEAILYEMAERKATLWHRRAAIVATLAFIRKGKFDATFIIVGKSLPKSHDLIHKAAGWMLREIGKNGGRDRLMEFLEQNAPYMPRTMLRYAIEHFDENTRKHYMSLTRPKH